jgi:hypothetical protein
MRHLLNPIERKTPISFVYSYKLADMFAERAKKQSDIVITMIELKTLSMMFVILSIVNEFPELVPVRSVIRSVEFGQAVARACLKLLIMTASVVLMN